MIFQTASLISDALIRLLAQLRVVLQIVQSNFHHAGGRRAQIERLRRSEPPPNQAVEHRVEENDGHIDVQILRQGILADGCGKNGGDFFTRPLR